METIDKKLSDCMPQISNEAYRFECLDAEELEETVVEERQENYQQISAESYRL
jgi:hypothetical protein